jgi:predicted metal-dependent hydrolase
MIEQSSLCPQLRSLPLEYKPSTRRKTLGLKLVPGRVLVFFPHRISQRELVVWLNSNSLWIVNHYVPLVEYPPSISAALAASDSILWHGQTLTLAVLVSRYPFLGDDFFDQDRARQRQWLLDLCIHEGAADLQARLEDWQGKLNLFSRSAKFRFYKSRWGSCSHNGEVALNLLLIMAPDWVRDYVVIHELCHLKHLNHSKRYWREVSRACSPQIVKQAKSWLRQHGDQLLSLYRYANL